MEPLENAMIESAQQDIKTRQEEKREKIRRDSARKKRRLIPPGVMLTAGAVSSIIMFWERYETRQMLVTLLHPVWLAERHLSTTVLHHMGQQEALGWPGKAVRVVPS